jgi:hypothetical protein
MQIGNMDFDKSKNKSGIVKELGVLCIASDTVLTKNLHTHEVYFES